MCSLLHKSFMTELEHSLLKRPIIEPWQVWLENGIKDCPAINSNLVKSLHEFCCTALRIVASVISLIDSHCWAVHKVSTKRSNIPLLEKYDIVVSLNIKNGTKVVRLTTDFGISTTLTTVLNNKDKIISLFLSDYMQKHDAVSGNPKSQRTLLALARLWHWTKKTL